MRRFILLAATLVLGAGCAAQTQEPIASAEAAIDDDSDPGGGDDPGDDDGDDQDSPAPSPSPGHNVTVKVLAFKTADSDGGFMGKTTEDDFAVLLTQWNAVAARSNLKVTFVRDPRTNLDQAEKSTIMNRDCIPSIDIDDIGNFKNHDLNGDGKGDSDDDNVLCDLRPSQAARSATALKYPDAAVVFFRTGRRRAEWNKTKGQWQWKTSGGTSSSTAAYINLPPGNKLSTLLAHEGGHYLHLHHTFRSRPDTVTKASDTLTKWIKQHPGQPFDRAFDGDRSNVSDTPGDPGIALFTAVHGKGHECEHASVTVPATLVIAGTPVSVPVTLTPDKDDVMSYWSPCVGDKHYTADQVDVIRDALHNRNRRALIDKSISDCAYDHGIAAAMPGKTWHELRVARQAILDACLADP
jgi:hypothetical protein